MTVAVDERAIARVADRLERAGCVQTSDRRILEALATEVLDAAEKTPPGLEAEVERLRKIEEAARAVCFNRTTMDDFWGRVTALREAFDASDEPMRKD